MWRAYVPSGFAVHATGCPNKDNQNEKHLTAVSEGRALVNNLTSHLFYQPRLTKYHFPYQQLPRKHEHRWQLRN